MYFVRCKYYEEPAAPVKRTVFTRVVSAVNHSDAFIKAYLEWDSHCINLMYIEDFVFEVYKASPTAGKNRTIELSDGCRIRVKEDGTILELSSIA